MKKILIIEDDKDIGELIADYLAANDFETQHEVDGFVGCEVALKEHFDLIIIDIMLPNMTGFEICKVLREKIVTPIFFVSAKTDNIDKIRGLGLGADDYITKPFNPNELVARVKSSIGRFKILTSQNSEKKSADLIIVGDLQINLLSHQLFKNNKEIILANKEFELLRYFIQNRNIVLSKEQIFDSLWDCSYGDITTVTVHIKRLREKIEDDIKKPCYIETIWGAGYRFM